QRAGSLRCVSDAVCWLLWAGLRRLTELNEPIVKGGRMAGRTRRSAVRRAGGEPVTWSKARPTATSTRRKNPTHTVRTTQHTAQASAVNPQHTKCLPTT